MDKGNDVDHPTHYQSYSGIECMDAIVAALGDLGAWYFCRGNVMKYTWRAGKKLTKVGNESDGVWEKAAEDMRKAAWYANYAADVIGCRDFGEKTRKKMADMLRKSYMANGGIRSNDD